MLKSNITMVEDTELKNKIKQNAPLDKDYDDFYVLELKLDNNKISELGYDVVDTYRFIKEFFELSGYLVGKNGFIYTKKNEGNMFSFYDELNTLFQKSWFKKSIIFAKIYRKVNFNINVWYENDYVIKYFKKHNLLVKQNVKYG